MIIGGSYNTADKENDIKSPDKFDYSNLKVEELRTLDAILSKSEKVTDNSIRSYQGIIHV